MSEPDEHVVALAASVQSAFADLFGGSSGETDVHAHVDTSVDASAAWGGESDWPSEVPSEVTPPRLSLGLWTPPQKTQQTMAVTGVLVQPQEHWQDKLRKQKELRRQQRQLIKQEKQERHEARQPDWPDLQAAASATPVQRLPAPALELDNKEDIVASLDVSHENYSELLCLKFDTSNLIKALETHVKNGVEELSAAAAEELALDMSPHGRATHLPPGHSLNVFELLKDAKGFRKSGSRSVGIDWLEKELLARNVHVPSPPDLASLGQDGLRYRVKYLNEALQHCERLISRGRGRSQMQLKSMRRYACAAGFFELADLPAAEARDVLVQVLQEANRLLSQPNGEQPPAQTKPKEPTIEDALRMALSQIPVNKE